MKILLTGFPPYDHFKQNSSQLLIESLKNDRPPAWDDIILEIVDFDNSNSSTQRQTMLDSLTKLLSTHKPDICLYCGQSPQRPHITVEALAINIFKGNRIEPNGPAACWTTLPGHLSLADRLQCIGIPAATSYHAGTHLCNHILFSALRYAQTHSEQPRCGFLHIPMLTQHAIDSKEVRPTISLPMARQALQEAILHIRNNT